MENSAQKAGFAIAAMIVVIVSAGIAVDWWDARNLGPVPINGSLNGASNDAAMKKLVEENERLKVENQLLNMRLDDLEKQLKGLDSKPAETPPPPPEPTKVEPNANGLDGGDDVKLSQPPGA